MPLCLPVPVQAAQQLRQVLATAPGATATPHIVGRSRGQKVCVDADEVQEELQVDDLRLQQVQVEASFSQPNGGMCQNMLSWARSCTGADMRGRAGAPPAWERCL